MKKQNGITLIALVITIIVLLILAGVSISLVIGDNGILTQATEAVTENRKASISEDIAMAWAGLETEYVRNWTTSTSAKKEDYFTEINFKDALATKGDVSDFNFDSESEVTKFKYSTNNNPEKEYNVVITEDGKVLLDGFAGMITAANYGDKVEYVAENGHDDWKIFYSNGENVFLIASDYIKNTLVSSEIKNGNTSTEYAVYWNPGPDTISKTARQDALFGITGSSYVLNSDYENSRCARPSGLHSS